MPFGRQAGPSVVYSYPALPPAMNLEVVEEQLWLAHQYRNVLVEIELARRERYGAIMKAFQPPECATLEAELTGLDQAIADINADIAARNAKAKRRLGTPEERARLKDIRTRRREVIAALRQVKGKLRDDPSLAAQVKASDERAFAEVRMKRGKCGVYWASYLKVEESVKRQGNPPRRHPYRGEGLLACQFQGGLSMADAYGCQDARLRLPYPGEHGGRVTARLRVQSDEGKPVWADIPIEIGRLPPDDARIKWAYLVRRRHKGTQWQWTLQLVLERAAGWADPQCAATGAVGIDLGWRLFEDRLRVAYWVGSDGREGEVSLPISVVEKWRYAESVQGTRDKRFDTARAALGDWLHLHRETCPEWLRERLRGLPHWRSIDRLAAVVFDWNTTGNEVANEESILPFLAEWRKQDRHLLRLSESVRQQAIDYRDREVGRKIAAQLRRQYRTIVVEDWNIKQQLRRPEAAAEESGDSSRLYHRMAAPGRLRQLLTAKAARVVRAPAANTTKTCHQCGSVEAVDGRVSVEHTCQACGVTYDIDQNAAINLLRYGEQVRESDGGEDCVDRPDGSLVSAH